MKDNSRHYHSKRRHGKEEASVSSFRFPLKLHLLLENSEHTHIISWLPDGKSFRCHDKDLFTKQIMPEYFGTTNYKAFQRNLNLWYVHDVCPLKERNSKLIEPWTRRQRRFSLFTYNEPKTFVLCFQGFYSRFQRPTKGCLESSTLFERISRSMPRHETHDSEGDWERQSSP